MAIGKRENPSGVSSDEETRLQHERREVQRGLERSLYAIVTSLLVVGLLAGAAIWLSGEAQKQAHRAEEARLRAELSAHEAHEASTQLWGFSSTAAALRRKTFGQGQRL